MADSGESTEITESHSLENEKKTVQEEDAIEKTKDEEAGPAEEKKEECPAPVDPIMAEPTSSCLNISVPSPKSTVSDVDTTSKSIESGEVSEQNECYIPDSHPFKQALLSFVPRHHQMYPVIKNEVPLQLESTPLVEVTTKEGLEELVQALKDVTEFGIDLEHSDHGFKAVTCLIQISTKTNDYIIDCLDKNVKDDLGLLQPVFADADILKIFHACTNDLKWLQQDFNLFVVNLFDTQLAMTLLGHKQLGLDAELARFGIVKQKEFQLHDFRKRPLSPEIKYYARTDSHFLIGIYNKLKAQLYDANHLEAFYEKCNDLCKKIHGPFKDNYFTVVDDLKAMHERQLRALNKLNKWRNGIAEFKDINPGKVLSKDAMSNLIHQIPQDPNQILAISKSQYVKNSLKEIAEILAEVNPQNRRHRGSIQIDHKNKRRASYNPHNANKRIKTHPIQAVHPPVHQTSDFFQPPVHPPVHQTPDFFQPPVQPDFFYDNQNVGQFRRPKVDLRATLNRRNQKVHHNRSQLQSRRRRQRN